MADAISSSSRGIRPNILWLCMGGKAESFEAFVVLYYCKGAFCNYVLKYMTGTCHGMSPALGFSALLTPCGPHGAESNKKKKNISRFGTPSLPPLMVPPPPPPCGVVWLWVVSPLPVVWCGSGVLWWFPPSPPVAWCGLGGSPLHVWICLGCLVNPCS